MGWVLNATPEVNDLSEYPKIIIIASILSFFSVAIVCMRLWIRIGGRGFASDDFMATLAMAFGLIYSMLCVAQTRYGLGLPIALRPKANLITYTRINFAGRPIYQMGISFFKIALLISYLRLLQGTDRRYYRVGIWVAIVTIFLAHVGCSLSLIFACNPVDKSWNPLKAGTCLPAGPSFTGYAVVTIVSDVLVAVIPLPLLVGLNIRNSQKIGLCGIFLLGLFTTLCSIFRYTQIDRIQFGDGNSTMLVLWGTIEFNVGNIVSSLPFLAPVLKRKVKDYRTKYSNSNSNGYGSHGASNVLNKSGEHYGLNSLVSKNRASAIGGNDPKTTGFTKLGSIGNASEERILAESPENNGVTILKTVEYDVRVDNVSDGGSSISNLKRSVSVKSTRERKSN